MQGLEEKLKTPRRLVRQFNFSSIAFHPLIKIALKIYIIPTSPVHKYSLPLPQSQIHVVEAVAKKCKAPSLSCVGVTFVGVGGFFCMKRDKKSSLLRGLGELLDFVVWRGESWYDGGGIVTGVRGLEGVLCFVRRFVGLLLGWKG